MDHITPTPPSAMEEILQAHAAGHGIAYHDVGILLRTMAWLKEECERQHDRADRAEAQLREREREVEQAISESAALIWKAVADLVAAGTPADGIGVIARGNAKALLTRRPAPEEREG